MKNRLFYAVSFILVLILSSFSVFAEENNDSLVDNSSSSNSTIIDLNESCELRQVKVGEKLDSYLDARDNNIKRLRNLPIVLNRSIVRLADAGYDVSSLEQDLFILEEKIMKFEEDYSVFLDLLVVARNTSCTDDFREALNNTKTQHKILREDLADIKQFVKENLNKNIRESRKGSRELIEERRKQVKDRIEEVRKNLTERKELRLENAEEIRERLSKSRKESKNRIENIRTELRERKNDSGEDYE